MNLRHYGLASALVLALAASAGCGGGTEAADGNGVPRGHGVNESVSFDDAYGRTTITVESAGTSETVFKDLTGEPIQSKNGTFVFVTFSKFDSPILGPDSLLELKGADGMLYGPDLSNGPDSGAAMAGFGETDPNHFTEAFDLPKEAASGAVLIVHERGTDRESMGSGISRPVPEGYEDGAHEVDLGL